MGNNLDAEEQHEAEILENPRTGDASPLYWACRNGDVAAVRKLVGSTDYSQLNELEPNGSTALHAAAHNGHTEIVRILLQEKSVMRHRRNLYGSTAYQEAKTDEIRALFDRPENSQRFCSDFNEQNGFVLENLKEGSLGEEEDDEDDDDFVSDELESCRLGVATTHKEIRKIEENMNGVKFLVRSPIMRGLVAHSKKVRKGLQETNFGDLFYENQAVARIKQIIDEKIPTSDSHYDKACSLISSYKTTGDITYLLRLYTLETPFYSDVNTENPYCLMNPVFHKMNRLKKRAFQGTSYRGLRMKKNDLRVYQLLHQQKQGFLSFTIFCSSSTKEGVARSFIRPKDDDRTNVLVEFNFPKKCETAIQLFELSAELPAITDFPHEFEVLILPFTIFRLTNVTYDEEKKLHRIYLEHFVSNEGMFASIKKKWQEAKAKRQKDDSKP